MLAIDCPLNLGRVHVKFTVPPSKLQAYGEMVQDTTYNLELRLQRIEEAITATDSTTAGLNGEVSASINLQDEREVTRQYLLIY